MDCPYCDTDKLAHSNLVPCVLEKCEGYEGDLELKNPLDLNDIMPYINYRLQQPHHSISIIRWRAIIISTDYFRIS